MARARFAMASIRIRRRTGDSGFFWTNIINAVGIDFWDCVIVVVVSGGYMFIVVIRGGYICVVFLGARALAAMAHWLAKVKRFCDFDDGEKSRSQRSHFGGQVFAHIFGRDFASVKDLRVLA